MAYHHAQPSMHQQRDAQEAFPNAPPGADPPRPAVHVPVPPHIIVTGPAGRGKSS